MSLRHKRRRIIRVWPKKRSHTWTIFTKLVSHSLKCVTLISGNWSLVSENETVKMWNLPLAGYDIPMIRMEFDFSIVAWILILSEV